MSQKNKIRCLELSISASEQKRDFIVDPPDQEWHVWKSASDLKTSGSFLTAPKYYSGDGYVVDFDLTMPSSEFKDKLYKLLRGQTKEEQEADAKAKKASEEKALLAAAKIAQTAGAELA